MASHVTVMVFRRSFSILVGPEIGQSSERKTKINSRLVKLRSVYGGWLYIIPCFEYTVYISQ